MDIVQERVHRFGRRLSDKMKPDSMDKIELDEFEHAAQEDMYYTKGSTSRNKSSTSRNDSLKNENNNELQRYLSEHQQGQNLHDMIKMNIPEEKSLSSSRSVQSKKNVPTTFRNKSRTQDFDRNSWYLKPDTENQGGRLRKYLARIFVPTKCFLLLSFIAIALGTALGIYLKIKLNNNLASNAEKTDFSEGDVSVLKEATKTNSGKDSTTSFINGLIPPPPQLSKICSAYHIKTEKGYNECSQVCDPARCCFVDNVDNCPTEDDKEICDAYSACAILEMISLSPTLSPIKDESIIATVESSIRDDDELLRLPPASLHLSQYCIYGGTKDQFSDCSQECAPASCCIAANLMTNGTTSHSSCYYGANIDVCNTYKACRTMDPNFSMLQTAEEQVLLSGVCGVEHDSKKCSEMCSAASCCFESSGPGACSNTLSSLCEAWSPCHEGMVTSRHRSSLDMIIQDKTKEAQSESACLIKEIDGSDCFDYCIPGLCCVFEEDGDCNGNEDFCKDFRQCEAIKDAFDWHMLMEKLKDVF